jgi:hypothetical protein
MLERRKRFAVVYAAIWVFVIANFIAAYGGLA